MLQHRAARFVLNIPWRRNHRDSITDMLMTLKWPSLENRRGHSRLILLFKFVNKLIHIPTQYLPVPSPLTTTRANHVRSKCRQETPSHSNLLCQQSHTNPKQFWRWINTVKGYRNPIPPLHDSGNTITKDFDKATLFNRYFCSVFTKENTSNLDSLTSESSHPTIIDSISITPEEVHAELCHLSVNKACGPDNITSFLLKNAADYISIPLCHLFNKSLSTGTLPFDWVSGNIVPIHKCNDKHNPSNYTVKIQVYQKHL